MRVYAYKVTSSEVETVQVGSTIVDYERGPKSEWGDVRVWHLYSKADGSFTVGWAGVRSQRLCSGCYRLERSKPRIHKHPGVCGTGPTWFPSDDVEEANL